MGIIKAFIYLSILGAVTIFLGTFVLGGLAHLHEVEQEGYECAIDNTGTNPDC